MRAIKKETKKDGTVILTVEERILFGLFKRLVRYSSKKVIIGMYREWLKEPNKTLVGDYMSLHLDLWCEALKKTSKKKK